MQLARRRFLHGLFKIADIACLLGSFTFALWYLASKVYRLDATEIFAMRVRLVNVAVLLAFVAIWHACFRLFGLYRSRRLSSRRAEIMDVVKATSLGSLLMLNLGLLFDIEIFTAEFLGFFWVLVTGSTATLRLSLRALLEQARMRGRNLRDVVIVGTNPRAMLFAQNIERRRELGYRVVGFFDDSWEGLGRLGSSTWKHLGDLDSFSGYLRGNPVDEVIVALPIATYYHEASRVVEHCEEQGVKVRFLSNFFNLTLGRTRVEMFDGEPVVLVHTGPPEGAAAMVKRGLDIVLSGTLIVLLAPVMLLVALAIKLTSPGPVFFVQQRVGLNKRLFNLYKFRTMVPDAEKKLVEIEHLNEISGPVFKIRNDPRVTSVGRFLRRTSLDELPQLFSVFRGDMSLVGPRPLPRRDYEGFETDWHRRRFSVRPGVTCLWQVSGRNSIPFERWMELDLEYIDRWSLWLDFKILALTIPAVLRGTGAS